MKNASSKKLRRVLLKKALPCKAAVEKHRTRKFKQKKLHVRAARLEPESSCFLRNFSLCRQSFTAFKTSCMAVETALFNCFSAVLPPAITLMIVCRSSCVSAVFKLRMRSASEPKLQRQSGCAQGLSLSWPAQLAILASCSLYLLSPIFTASWTLLGASTRAAPATSKRSFTNFLYSSSNSDSEVSSSAT